MFLNKFKNDIFKNVSYNFIFYALNLLLVYVIAVIITKYFGSEVYGRYSLIKSMIMILIVFNTIGLNTNAIRLSANKDYFYKGYFKSDYILKSYKILFILSLFFMFFFIIFRKFIANDIFNDPGFETYLKILPFVLFFAVFLNFNSNVLKGQGKILKFSFVSSFLNNFIFLFLILIVYNFINKGVNLIMEFLLISFIISFLTSLKYIIPIKNHKNARKTPYRELIKDSLPMMLSSTMIFIIFSLDTLMIGFFESSQKVGVYRVVSQISALNGIFYIVFSSVVAPKISTYFSENKLDKIESLVLKSSKTIFFITFPILFIIILFSNKILVFFGEEFLEGRSSIIILSICQFLYAFTGFVDLILNMTKKQSVFGKITIATAFCNVVLNLSLIPTFGITGAAIATGLSLLLTNIFAILYIKREYGYIPFYFPKKLKTNKH